MNSEKIDQIAIALTKVQGKLRPAAKDARNPFFDARYASIAAVWEACRNLLAENDLAVSQIMEPVDGTPHLSTLLIHSSGQWLKSQMPILPKKQDPQSFGSALTYARRYGLAAIVGVVSDDDDGNQASKPVTKPVARPANNNSKPKSLKVEFASSLKDELEISFEEIATVLSLIGGFDIEIIEEQKEFVRFIVKLTRELEPADIQDLVKVLDRKYEKFDPAKFDEQYKFVLDHFEKDEISF